MRGRYGWRGTFGLAAALALVVVLVAGSLVGCGGKRSGEAKFPSKAVTIIVPMKPGGGTDTMVRGIQPYLQKYLGVPVLVENVPGPGSVAAINQVLKAEPDGHTIIAITTPIMVSVHLYEKEMGLKEPFLESFKPIYAFLTADGNGIVVRKGTYTSIEQLVEEGKKRPLRCAGATGIGSSDHVTMLQFSEAYGVPCIYVPHGSAGEAVASLLGGHVDFGMVSLSGEAVDFSRLDMLAVSLDKRFEGYPDIPTFAELGHPEMTLNWCVGTFAPPGTPDDRVKILEQAHEKAFHDPDFQAWAKNAKKPIGDGWNAKQWYDFLKSYESRALKILPKLQEELQKVQTGSK